MGQIETTYALIRLLEEQTGALLSPGDVLVYRSSSRFPWIDLVFDLEPGTRCRVTSAEYDTLSPDSDPLDNHYFYGLEGLEEHGGIVTTEIVAMFDVAGSARLLDELAASINGTVLGYRGKVLGQVLSEQPEDATAN